MVLFSEEALRRVKRPVIGCGSDVCCRRAEVFGLRLCYTEARKKANLLKVYWILLTVLLTLSSGNCSPLLPESGRNLSVTSSGPNEKTSEPVPLTGETETNPSLPIPAVRDMESVIENARADLAQRLSIPASQISLIESREVIWADSSLGCPQSGNTYTQVQTPGYLIILESNGNQFVYHANIHNHVFYCENPTPAILETPENVHP